MDDQRIVSINEKIFLVIFPLILVFYALFPYSILLMAILTFISIFIFLGLDFGRKLPWLLIILAILLAVSTFFSINRINSVPYLFFYLVIFLVATTFYENKKPILVNSFIIGTLLIGALSSLYSFLKIIFDRVPSFLSFLNAENNLIVPFFGHAFYAIFLIATFPFVLEKVKRRKIVFWLYLIFLLMTFSKGVIVIGFLEIIIFILIKILKKELFSLRSVVIPTIFIVSIFILFLFVSISRSNWLKSKVFKPSFPSRIEYWTQDMKTIKNASLPRLLFGYGLDSFFDLSNKYQSRPQYWARSSHNFLVQFWIENGLIAALILSVFLVLAIAKNFKKYRLAEKIAIFSLLLASFGTTYDLNTLPVLLFFFIILLKTENNCHSGLSRIRFWSRFAPQNDVRGSRNKFGMTFILMMLFLFFYWLKYLFAYGYFFLSSKPKVEAIKIFPYEGAFWTILIDTNKGKKEELIEIDNQLKKYSVTNLELKRLIIDALYQTKEYCLALSLTKDSLLVVPFDVSTQNKLIESFNKCRQKNKEEWPSFFSQIKPRFDASGDDLYQIGTFLDFTARYYLKMGKTEESLYWFEKSWQANPWNQKRMENIDMIGKLDNFDKQEAIRILKKFLLVKEKTNYKYFDTIRKKTAKEWLVLAKWERELKLINEAKLSYSSSLNSYSYDGDAYFQYAQFLRENSFINEVQNIYQLCKKNFNNAPWCDDIIKYYGQER